MVAAGIGLWLAATNPSSFQKTDEFMQATKSAVLILSDGTRFPGRSFGFEGSTSGEVVFNTAMTEIGRASCRERVFVRV